MNTSRDGGRPFDPDAGAPLRLSGVSFLNAQPVLHGLLTGMADDRMRVTLAEPSELSRMLFEDEVDAALAPVAPLATHGDLEVVPDIALGCHGPVRSVLLVGERPIESLDEVLLDASSRTSVVLARLVLRHLRGGDEPRYCARPASEIIQSVAGGTGGLIIGDIALELSDRFAYRIDLGQAWMEMTGLPFVFAVWVARPGRLDHRDAVVLSASMQAGLAARPQIARSWARGHGGDPEDHLRYLTDSMRYALDAEALAGLREFLRRAAEAGLLPAADVRFVGSRAEQRPSNVAAKAAGFGRAAGPRSVDRLLTRAAAGERISLCEALVVHDAPLEALGQAADTRRRTLHPDGGVTYAVDRHIAYTNVCEAGCGFCDFARRATDPDAFALPREQIGECVRETLALGGKRVLLQGGLNPRLHLEWFEGLFQWLKQAHDVELHALSPEEVLHLVRIEDLGVQAVLERLAATGLDAIAGTGAEVLTDRVRALIAPRKCTSAEWLDVMRISHRLGMRAGATMMFGTFDETRDRLLHLIKLRDLQDETGGFTGFAAFRFQPTKATAGLSGDLGDETHLRLLAVARLVLDNFDHLQVVATGRHADSFQASLRFGANQLVAPPFEQPGGVNPIGSLARDPAWTATPAGRVGLRLLQPAPRARG